MQDTATGPSRWVKECDGTHSEFERRGQRMERKHRTIKPCRCPRSTTKIAHTQVNNEKYRPKRINSLFLGGLIYPLSIVERERMWVFDNTDTQGGRGRETPEEWVGTLIPLYRLNDILCGHKARSKTI